MQHLFKKNSIQNSNNINQKTQANHTSHQKSQARHIHIHTSTTPKIPKQQQHQPANPSQSSTNPRNPTTTLKLTVVQTESLTTQTLPFSKDPPKPHSTNHTTTKNSHTHTNLPRVLNQKSQPPAPTLHPHLITLKDHHRIHKAHYMPL